MKYLFSEDGAQILESLTFTRTLFAFDFDGTLAPIVKQPEDARMRKSTTALLARLMSVAPVAILSGRALSDLRERLPLSPGHLIGNHGSEGLPNQNGESEATLGACAAWSRAVERAAGSSPAARGVYVEDKGHTLALHYRNARSRRLARQWIFEVVERLSPTPRLVLGKSVVNLIPAGVPHKGVALLELMMHERVKCALYIGDDDTDEDVFSLPDGGIVSARVGRKLGSHAQFFIKRQSEINKLLQLLTQALEPQ